MNLTSDIAAEHRSLPEPELSEVHSQLARLYSFRLKDEAQATWHRDMGRLIKLERRRELAAWPRLRLPLLEAIDADKLLPDLPAAVETKAALNGGSEESDRTIGL